MTPWHLASLRGSEAESRARQRLTANANGPCAKDGAGAGGRGSPNARSAEGACERSRQGAGETPARPRALAAPGPERDVALGGSLSSTGLVDSGAGRGPRSGRRDRRWQFSLRKTVIGDENGKPGIAV